MISAKKKNSRKREQSISEHRTKQTKLALVREGLRQQIEQLDDLDKVLYLAKLYGFINWQNNDGFFHDAAIEEFIYKRTYKKILATVEHYPSKPHYDHAHIVTHVREFGGHTKLLNNLLEGLNNSEFKECLLVNESLPAKLKPHYKKVDVFVCHGSESERLLMLVNSALAAKTIVFHIHPNDIISAVAMMFLKKIGRRTIFVNHADHVFSYGLSTADMVLEVSGFGWDITENTRDYVKHSFLGIPQVIDGYEEKVDENKKNSCHEYILSVGQREKYRPYPGLPSFPEIVEKLLKTLPSRYKIELIGPEATDSWWKNLVSRYQGRLILHGKLDFDQTNEKIANAKCYIDSYPMNGGTVFAEALMHGCTVFGLGKNSGYNLAQSLYSPSEEALINDVYDFLIDKKTNNQEAVRCEIRDQYSIDAVVERFLIAEKDHSVGLPKGLVSDLNTTYYSSMWKSSKEPLRLWFARSPLSWSERLRVINIVQPSFVGYRYINLKKFIRCLYWLVTNR